MIMIKNGRLDNKLEVGKICRDGEYDSRLGLKIKAVMD